MRSQFLAVAVSAVVVASVPPSARAQTVAAPNTVTISLACFITYLRDSVEVNAWWNSETVEIVISDDGPGIAPDMLKRIGEPYLSRRPSADQGEHGGLGLGVFIARTLLERTGAKVAFTNRQFPDHGAVVQIVWPRDRFETPESKDTPDT